jgi:hypothetical protein
LFQGGGRYKQQNFQDAMAIVRKFGKPDLFITVTCNPNWNEIKEAIKEQEPQFRPDIIARVFRQKLKNIMKDILKNHVFGIPVGHVYVIEFQKRGLPHAHILIILRHEDKIRDVRQIDSIISAEIPDPSDPNQAKLFEYVTKHMLHGLCGLINMTCPCMEEKKCTKGFPKNLREETDPNCDGYPLYRRRNNCIFYEKHLKNDTTVIFNNDKMHKNQFLKCFFKNE